MTTSRQSQQEASKPGTKSGLLFGITATGRYEHGLSDARQGRITLAVAALKRFSYLLLQVAVGLTSLIFGANLLLHRPLIESLLFSLAIAVGITPQLLPATEADHRQARTSTAGQNPLDAALWDSGQAKAFEPARYERLDTIPFDHQRRRTSVLIRDGTRPGPLTKETSPWPVS